MTPVIAVLLSVLLLQLSVSSVWCRSFGKGQIGFRSRSLTSDVHQVEATDGLTALQATVSRHGFLTCNTTQSPAAVSAIVNHPTVTFRVIGTDQVHDLWRRCARALSSRGPTDINQSGTAATGGQGDQPFEPDLETGKPQGHGAHLAIIPGTHWCGKGNVAETYEDLGEHAETDKCCRSHDHCPYYIPGLTTKYNYFNMKPWTVSFCTCDTEFFQCLKSVNNSNSDIVGKLFFGVLGVHCFEFSEGEYCKEYHWTHLWCSNKDNGPMAVLKEFPYTWTQTPGQPIGK